MIAHYPLGNSRNIHVLGAEDSVYEPQSKSKDSDHLTKSKTKNKLIEAGIASKNILEILINKATPTAH